MTSGLAPARIGAPARLATRQRRRRASPDSVTSAIISRVAIIPHSDSVGTGIGATVGVGGSAAEPMAMASRPATDGHRAGPPAC